MDVWAGFKSDGKRAKVIKSYKDIVECHDRQSDEGPLPLEQEDHNVT